MSVTIIIKKTLEKGRIGIIRNMSQAIRSRVSRENRQEYDNEKRALELNAKMPCGHEDAKAVAIAVMMDTDEHKIKKILANKKKTKVMLDGKID